MSSAAPAPGINTTDFGQFAKLRSGAKDRDPETIKQVARQFEALFTQMLLKASHSDDTASNDLLGGSGSDTYRDIYDQQMAAQLSSGKGLGLADLLARQLIGAQTPGTESATAPTGLRGRSAATSATSVAPVSGKAAESADAFVDEITPFAEKAAKELGIPARVLVAQAAHETGWGKRQIKNADSTDSHNLFGIKASRGWEGATTNTTTHEYVKGERRVERAEFRSYKSVGEAFEDYVSFVKDNPRYAEALKHGGSGEQYLQGLQQAGYATDPAYAQKIARVAYGRTMSATLDASPARPGMSSGNTWET
ncbi:flagellar assembly peptidoglycan hydrolase FlgJ [Nevskia ramosa]|uniref:flagellar assembly peptidoglycan hydrolase FlgJ n=1 Tax=Nevskia ramosa TaxID=64002 RepID=UPI0003B4CCE6|nr:flagellar assembly peptidoglycan hydrolase FlgJ [Nevskia ramosa]